MLTRKSFLKSIIAAVIHTCGMNVQTMSWAQASREEIVSEINGKTLSGPLQSSGSLSMPISAMWINSWELPTIGQLPTDVVDINTLYIMAMAQSSGNGTGKIAWGPTRQTPEQAKNDIACLLAKGKKVSLGIGGASDGGIYLTDETHAGEMFGCIESLVAQYGFTGIDVDMEPSGGKWNEESLKILCSKLKGEYGKDFTIGFTMGMYGPWTEKWLSAARLVGLDGYDYWAPMLYDFPEAHDDRLIEVALDKVRKAVSGGVPSNRQILGFMCNAYYNTSPVPVALRAWNDVKGEFPDIAGAFIWESKLECQSNYEWTRTVGKAIRSL